MPLIYKIMHSAESNILSFKYQEFTTSRLKIWGQENESFTNNFPGTS